MDPAIVDPTEDASVLHRAMTAIAEDKCSCGTDAWNLTRAPMTVKAPQPSNSCNMTNECTSVLAATHIGRHQDGVADEPENNFKGPECFVAMRVAVNTTTKRAKEAEHQGCRVQVCVPGVVRPVFDDVHI